MVGAHRTERSAPVRLAVIAAAGRGTRFLPSTKTVPKELLPLFDRPVIQHLVEEVAAAEVPELVIVTRPGTAEPLRRYFSRDPDWDLYLAGQAKQHLLRPLYELLDRVRIEFATQPPDLPYGTGAPLLAVRDRLTAPCVDLSGDDAILEQPPGSSLRALLDLYRSTGAAAVVAACRVPLERIPRLGSIAYRPGGEFRVDHLIEKPPIHLAPSDYTPIGRMVLSPEILPILDDQRLGLKPGQELWQTDALSTLAGRATVLAPPIPGRWLTTGDPHSLLEAALAFAESSSR